MENYVKAVLYAYPTLEKMEQAYTVHIRNMAVLSYRQDLPAVAMAGKIVGQILQKRKLAWLKALVEKSVRRLSDEEKEIVARSFRWKKQSGDNTTKTKYRRLSKKLLDKLGKCMENAGLTYNAFQEEFATMELFQHIQSRLKRKAVLADG